MRKGLLILSMILMCGVASAQIRRVLKDDLEKINHAYALLREAQFVYTYHIFNDSLSRTPLQTIKVNIGKYGNHTYTAYENMQMLSDTNITIVVDENDKRVTLFRQETTLPAAGVTHFIDTVFLNSIFESVIDVRVKNAGGLKEYTLFFRDREYTCIRFAFNAKYLLQSMTLYLDTPEYNPESETPPPAVLQMVCTNFKNKVSDKKMFNTGTYFKQFGNGQYVLNDQYATYRLINLYESQQKF